MKVSNIRSGSLRSTAMVKGLEEGGLENWLPCLFVTVIMFNLLTKSLRIITEVSQNSAKNFA